MKQGKMSLQDLALEIQRQNEMKRDFIADTRTIRMSVNGIVGDQPVLKDVGSPGPVIASLKVTDSDQFEITEVCHGQISDKIGIPKGYYDRMRKEAPQLLERNVNHWFEEQPKKQMIRTLDGKARAFLSDRYRRMDNFELANCVLPIIKEQQLKLASFDMTDRFLYMKALFPKVRGEVAVGDVVESGVMIRNSEIGMSSLVIWPFVNRLVCENGLVLSDSGFRRKHIGRHIEDSEESYELYSDETIKADDMALMLKVRDVVAALANPEKFALILEDMRAAKGQKIEGKPEKAVEELGKKYSMSQGECSDIFRALVEGSDLSKYGLMNAVTNVSQRIESYDRATEFEIIGGKILTMPEVEWSQISKVA